MPEIFLDSLSFSFGSRLILDRVSLHVSNGERAFLIGPNGVGKSTLLRILTGDLTPDSGRIVSGPVPEDLTVLDETSHDTIILDKGAVKRIAQIVNGGDVHVV